MGKEFNIGLDIGTDSLGWAVTDAGYNLLKFHGEPAWGVTIFDKASLSEERRNFRTARRRLDRRQQRVDLIKELFAPEISKIDPRFFIRIEESYKYREEAGDRYILFNDGGFSDKEYYNQYPTIHHLICDLMTSKEPHDVRLVYIACAWLVAHRGHFLSNINQDNLSSIRDFSTVYNNLIEYFVQIKECAAPWEDVDIREVESVISKKCGVLQKAKNLAHVLLGDKKPEKAPSNEFPFSQEAIIKLLSGGTCKVKDLFGNPEYEENGSISLGMDEEKFGELMGSLGDDYELIDRLRAIYDWTVLNDAIGNNATISEAKVKAYEQHKSDLCFLKHVIKKYKKESYDSVFRTIDKKLKNYVSYSYHVDGKDTKELHNSKATKEEFCKYILSVVKEIEPDSKDQALFNEMKERLELNIFMPKQKNTDNRVIPYQLYYCELNQILEAAENYLPFLNDVDEDGLTVTEKIKAVFMFRVPYFVGPLNKHAENSWVIRKAGKIYPWNFEKMVDLDASENEFIKRLLNKCSYLPGEPVLPKDSLCYHKFLVLNEINNLRINNVRISVSLKQKIYNELFMKIKKVTRKKLDDFLVCEGFLEKNDTAALTGIDGDPKSNLIPQIAFRNLLSKGDLKESDVERIIERSSYAEDKSRLCIWVKKEYPELDDEDVKYIAGLKFHDFGRLSRRFLTQFEAVNKETGEMTTILNELWNSQCNLMELLSDRYTFAEELENYAALRAV